MKKLLILSSLVSLLISCDNNTHKEKTAAAESTTPADRVDQPSAPAPSPRPLEKFLGSFVGPFGDNKITMLITKVEGDSVVGRTIVGGNDRPFRGTFKKEGTTLTFTAKEPGDHRDDGEFNFSIDESN